MLIESWLDMGNMYGDTTNAEAIQQMTDKYHIAWGLAWCRR